MNGGVVGKIMVYRNGSGESWGASGSLFVPRRSRDDDRRSVGYVFTAFANSLSLTVSPSGENIMGTLYIMRGTESLPTQGGTCEQETMVVCE